MTGRSFIRRTAVPPNLTTSCPSERSYPPGKVIVSSITTCKAGGKQRPVSRISMCIGKMAGSLEPSDGPANGCSRYTEASVTKLLCEPDKRPLTSSSIQERLSALHEYYCCNGKGGTTWRGTINSGIC